MKPLFLLIAVFSLPTWAQNCAQIDEKLTIHYQKMQIAGSYSDHFDDEVLERETKLFTETLQFFKKYQRAGNVIFLKYKKRVFG